MSKIGFDFPEKPRQTAVLETEDWYQNFLAEKLDRPWEPIKRSNFGQYDMAVNYLTSVIEEAKAINKIAVFNIDHMAQIKFTGQDTTVLLDRVLPVNVASMKIGQCKYTLLLNEKGCVLDDMIIMKTAESEYIIVINAGHDLTGKGMDHGHEVEVTSDADVIMKYKKDREDVKVEDISHKFVKIDVQGPYSYKLITKLYGQSAVRNRNNPDKNMGYFNFNEFEIEGKQFIISRTGYTNRWGWELYIPTEFANAHFQKIILEAWALGGMLVGLGGRDENRISAGNFGLPLNGQEYDSCHTPTNSPLFDAAIDLQKDSFIGKEALLKDIEDGVDKHMVLLITEGIATGRGIYLNGQRIGSVTSSINSPNVSQEKREFIGSSRKNVIEENGTAAIGLGWLYHNPFAKDESGKDILELNGTPVRIKVEFFKENTQKQPSGKPLVGYISGNGVNPATAPKALKEIENL